MDAENKVSAAKVCCDEARKKKKPYDSMKITTGNIDYNIKQFNKHMGSGNDNNNPSTAEAQTRAAAKAANKAAGTINAATPDGSAGVGLGAGSEASGGSSGAGEGGGMCEAIKLDEEKLYAAKLAKEIELPDNIHIIDKDKIEAELELLDPEEEFTVGYVTPIFFYKELVDKFTLLKCTQLTGYTGVDYIEARADDVANKAARIQLSKDAIKLGTDKGNHLDRRPWAKEVGDFSAQYASTNKTVLQDHGNTLLFYPRVGSTPKVSYYLDLYDGSGYMKIDRELLEDTILEYVRSFIPELCTGIKKDGTRRALRWGDRDLVKKIRTQLASDEKTIDAIPLTAESKFETRSRIATNDIVIKPQVRALYTNQLYYLKTPYAVLGQPLSENLTEAKRYVRRYYIRPQNIFCSNKTDILNALINIDEADCTVYTLNNLGDEKDVTKLTNKDIIYYYKDGILYDKNMLKVMDYDLYIKHEENRDKINPEAVSDITFNKVYHDRLTGEMDEAFNLTFTDVNAYGEQLVEGKTTNGICCICGEELEGYGNNPKPYKQAKQGERCCDACNFKFVIPARIEQMQDKRDI